VHESGARGLLLSMLCALDGQQACLGQCSGTQDPQAGKFYAVPRRASWQGQPQPCGPPLGVVITPAGQASPLPQDGAPVQAPK
jgi:hypothetical protein